MAKRDRTDRDDRPMYAEWSTGIHQRPCILDCDQMTDRPDAVCKLHDFDLGRPRWDESPSATSCDFGRQSVVDAKVAAWYAAKDAS